MNESEGQRMGQRNTVILGLGLVLLLGGCVGRRSINYLNDPSLSNGSSKLFENRKFEYRIQVNDVMSVRVMGLDDATSRFFNVEQQNGMINASDAALYVNGYSVDKNGQIQLPTVGKIKLQGLTVGEAQELVQRKINEYFNNATVILKMVNWRISILGNVSKPGAYLVYNNQITILDALAMAGGPNEFADKTHITLMRQSERGVQALYVDMSTTGVLSSEYYYLLPNDIVFVPTLRARPARLNLEMLSILLAVTSTGVLLFTAIQNANR
ncbi:MAG: polysaccharide export protein [Flavobacteriales bacterium]|nr:polysaccharide export protein [Flavobacteriales bacterium]MBP6643027.1 polysaccharide export protein [Flavobacteriales bacterium]MBP7155516.1 polysaccharide export protein [Flavobacteriales bacterium]HQV74625.1 polysaccharide biosynthesis/export family protein [Flavobacteriales bacterium]